ncbi:hypothetical protein [Photobacterium phosphoreum]|uniref:hypothetical protein n=1 Tax=Photobacterium phosphoreum TaxID=659 RepID=UPI000D167428|nr:hypothetical protein [Photobacterium phosphoreum]PSU70772.1 hypothetical protein CTM67_20175 [Photobacterium phosphoreum]PTB30992.1 hypothetical protein DAT36_19305 [Photobacterium phosphoreum]
MKKLILLALLFPSLSHAIVIDSMLKVADSHGTGVYTVSNNDPDPAFVNVKLSKVETKDGKLIKTPYTKSNLLEWDATLTQNKFILDPLMAKKIGVRALCADGCNPDHDTIFAVQFTPSPYSKDGEMKGVAINYGYESIFVIPAKNKKISYSIEKNNENALLKNTGNTTLEVFFNQCSALFKADCSTKVIMLPGRVRKLVLPKNARKGKIDVFISSVDDTFYKKEVVTNGKNTLFNKVIQ